MARTWFRCVAVVAMAASAILLAGPGESIGAETDYWLQFGKPAHTCTAGETPFKVQGASWGVLASGIVMCRPIQRPPMSTRCFFLNVFVDPTDKNAISRDVLDFDWCGMALYRPSRDGYDVDWLYERSMPIKGSLRKDSTGKIVFGNIVFEVPRADADSATNMLFYLTFMGPMVVIGAV